MFATVLQSFVTFDPPSQASSSSLDYLHTISVTEERIDRRSSIDNRLQQKLERKNSGNVLDKGGDRVKRSSLERYGNRCK